MFQMYLQAYVTPHILVSFDVVVDQLRVVVFSGLDVYVPEPKHPYYAVLEAMQGVQFLLDI